MLSLGRKKTAEPAGKLGRCPAYVEERARRACEQIDEIQPRAEQALAFWRGDHYVYVTSDGKLSRLPTVTGVNCGKPPHRVRNTWNLIRAIVEGRVSAATQRIPGYEVSASTTDPEDVAAARLASKVAFYGYEQWRMRRMARKATTLAIVTGEAFAMPYFDPHVGPFREVQIIDQETGEPLGESRLVGQGEVKIRVLSRTEVGWEPGLDFEDSPWFIVRQARHPRETEQAYGLPAKTLKPDAASQDRIYTSASQVTPRLVMVTEYYERPNPDRPQGRMLVMANGLVLFDGTYPSWNQQGEIVDEPICHRLSYTVDPANDRDMSLVELLIDPQRTLNDAHSKISEWKNRVLNPQILAPVGSIKGRITDEPGAIIHYTPVAGQVPQWEQRPSIPPELFRLVDVSREIMYELAAVDNPPANLEAARARQLEIERAQQRWQAFLADLADWHARVMRHCLALVARYYTEARLLKIKGRFGPEVIRDFRGSDLRGQIDVTVLPGSIEPRTRQAVMQQIQWIATVFPGWLTPEVALAALNGGTAEKLLESYELDVARAHQVIERLKEGPEAFLSEPITDPSQPPSWMPRPFDNIAVHKAVFADWMKTSDYEMAPEPVKEAANLYWQGLEWLEAQKAARQAAMQAQMAQQLGMANASRSPVKGMPSLPGNPGSAEAAAAGLAAAPGPQAILG